MREKIPAGSFEWRIANCALRLAKRGTAPVPSDS
jgi:hypothetical protein